MVTGVTPLVAAALCLVVQAATALSPKACDKFYDLDFELESVERYEEYFDDNTELTLAQAGVYRGPADIREYVKFAQSASPFVELDLLETSSGTLLGVTKDELCAFRFFRLSNYRLSDKYTEDGPSFMLTSMIKLAYDPARNKVAHIYVYFDVPYLEWIFEEQLSDRQVSNWLCGVMEEDCPMVWANDATLTSRDACVKKFEALPVLDDGDQRHFDGNVRGCRVLHGVFASKNEHHCAHISFVPMEDPDGIIKCQESLRLNTSDYFDALDLENFNRFKDAVGIPERGYERVSDFLDEPKVGFGRDLDFDASPLSRLSDTSFDYMAAGVAWFTVCYIGFGSEIVIGLWFYRRLNLKQRDIIDQWWIVTQWIYPLFLLVALVSQAAYGYIFLSVGIWKAGSPEVLYYLTRCFNTRRRGTIFERINGFFSGFGLIIHHGTASWTIVCIINHIFPLDRITLSVCLPLVVQHTTTLVQYVSYPCYIISCLLVEIWFEWEVLYYRNKRNYNHEICSWLILTAHWMFIFDYALQIASSIIAGKRSANFSATEVCDAENGTRNGDGSRSVSGLNQRRDSRHTITRFLTELMADPPA